ncbi:DUF6379 domain-containing protein [Sphingomonas sp. RB3P16]|uniref:C-glycoside deglycosidase beta subunit domain-containing protein n=1 Tax=Parasphingomonas frigoris TaxID=3096163 RepID=UPI002FCBB88B
MFDNQMICTDGFENVVENGETVGFAFFARLPYYRGLGLSMIEDIGVTVDGAPVAREAIRFSVRGRSWTLDAMEAEYGDRWNFGEKARITVLQPGGLPVGPHRIELAERLRISYLPFVPTSKDAKDLVLAA